MFRIFKRVSTRDFVSITSVFVISIIFIGFLSTFQQGQGSINLTAQISKQVPGDVSNNVLGIENMNRSSEDFFQNPRLVPPGGPSEAEAVNDSIIREE